MAINSPTSTSSTDIDSITIIATSPPTVMASQTPLSTITPYPTPQMQTIPFINNTTVLIDTRQITETDYAALMGGGRERRGFEWQEANDYCLERKGRLPYAQELLTLEINGEYDFEWTQEAIGNGHLAAYRNPQISTPFQVDPNTPQTLLIGFRCVID